MAFEVAYAGYQKQQENLQFVQLTVKQGKIKTDELEEVVEYPPPQLRSLSKPTTQNQKKKDKKR